MKTVINITLGGRVFAIEEDAHAALSQYLESIRTHLAREEDKAEILEDVETAMAEKLIARKKNEKVAVTNADVDQLITELGEAGAFGEGSASDQSAGSAQAGADAPEKRGQKRRLYRDTDNAVIAGVASGLAQYFDIDPVIVRIIFVLTIFANGLGILAYIILWLVVPAAQTTAEKYAMSGDPVTLREISDRVKKNITSDKVRSAYRGIDAVFSIFGVIVRAMLKAVRYVGGALLVIGGALGIAGLVSTYSVILLSKQTFFPHEVQIALEVLTGSVLGIVSMMASFCMMIVPFIVSIWAGASLLSGRNYFTIQKSITLVVVWIIASAIAFSTTALQVEEVMQKLGPIEGRFDDEYFEMHFKDGRMYGDRHGFWFMKTDDADVLAFRQQLEEAIRIEIGQPIEGYEPAMFTTVFTGMEESDFDGVEALIGKYEYEDGALLHEVGKTQMIHSAAGAIAPEGYETLLDNILKRLDVQKSDNALSEIMTNLRGDQGDISIPPFTPDEPVACTADAKICPDGTGVGRVGPNCEFAACPGETSDAVEVMCTDAMKENKICTKEYAPVCGQVEVQCVTTPCPPIPETFGNGCTACAEGNVISYTAGACEI